MIAASANRMLACSARARTHDRVAVAHAEAAREELRHRLEQVEHDPSAEELGDDRGEHEGLGHAVDLHHGIAASHLAHGQQQAHDQPEREVLHGVARHPATTARQRQAPEGDGAPALEAKLSGRAQADHVHLVTRCGERLDLPPRPSVGEKTMLPDDAYRGHRHA